MLSQNCHILPLSALFKRAATLAIPLSIVCSHHAQAREHDVGGWLSAALEGPIGAAEDTPWEYVLHGEYRAYDALDGIRYSVLRAGMGYDLGGGWSISGAYDRHHTRLVEGGSLTENRLWQAVEWKTDLDNGWTFSTRSRLEQRHFDGRDGLRWRFRQNAKLKIPFRSQDHMDWIFSVEPFFQVHNPDGSSGGLGQVRSFAGINFDTGDHSRIEVGYLNQWGRVRRGEDLVNHMLQVNFRFSQ